ncbi:hypothetical protein H2200_002414 [Cladophialophora chaetospira]|uniref:Uncharacterized protein n=1 Tax=Cladophialophora chaetospira TaxID=386627 RepID=A0AA38XJ29_9EURO|nr:hypothetical protein H2200_002414 [Cladophialophora chaetospira]
MKSKKASSTNAFTVSLPFPKQPWIYVSDPTDNNIYADKVHDMINAAQFHYGDLDDDLFAGTSVTSVDSLLNSLDKSKDKKFTSNKAFLIVDKLNIKDDASANKIETAKKVREHAAKSGRTFASVNLYKLEGTKESDVKNWGPNHLELSVTGLTFKQVAEKVYKWLFTVIPPTEHIYLLTQAKLQVTDKKQYPDYEYCSLSDIKNQPKDAKIQFGVVITSKPVVVPGTQRLHWTVADKSGTGNFYFQYRGPSSQFTWDWVQSLQPGDIKSLPRMPSIVIREPRRLRIAKLPLRTASFFITPVGLTLKCAGKGLIKVGDILQMGKSSEFVPDSDVDKKTGKRVDWAKKFEQEGKEREGKVEKARKDVRERILARLSKKREAGIESDDDTLYGSGGEKGIVSEKEFC